MKFSVVLILLVFLSLTAAATAQNPNPRKPKISAAAAVNPANEKADFEKAVAIADAQERIAALQKFIADYPKSKERTRALELTTSARAALADEKMRAGDRTAGIELFQLALRETPKPVSDKLFAEVVLQIPNSLFYRGETKAAIETAKTVEEKIDGDAKQLLALATFYLGMENAAEAKRLANRAAQLDANLPAAYQTLGIANRLDFQFDESVAAYQKALELDADSTISKRSLAEMKSAVGKSSEAVALYREILAKDAADAAAQNGLILALFEAENKTEAEAELQKSLAANPNNLFLLTGTAYWYAAHGDGAKAVELAERAVAVEPRYTWARIALARGLMQQKRPADAEKTLLAAKQYGDFPTLDYELAATRFQAGFYREAAETLRQKFAVKDEQVMTKLGNRVQREAKTFTELLAAERRASIFQTRAADDAEIAERLKTLLDFSQKLDASNDEATLAAADNFLKGDDQMKLHRQLFVANQLVQRTKSLPKVLELTRQAVASVEGGLDAPNATAAILADELYQSRRIAMTRNELVIVPQIARPTLSNIVRGRIEDLAGWALFQENKPAEAALRLKRAVSVLPEKSSWWRSAMWRLGTAHDAGGNYKDALDAYVKSYLSGETDIIKYGVIETVYQKVNGTTDGLEAKIGAKPASLASNLNQPTKPNEAAKTIPTAETKPETAPTPIVTENSAPIIKENAPPIEEKTPAGNQETKIEKTVEPVKIETKPATNNELSESKSKPLFEPIIINVPKVEPPPKKANETDKENESPDANDKPRVPVEKTDGQTAAPCKITADQEVISIVNDGGILSVALKFENTESKEIRAVSDSPADIEVMPASETEKQVDRFLFTVKSISRKTGNFIVTFESVCGKKEVLVNVR